MSTNVFNAFGGARTAGFVLMLSALPLCAADIPWTFDATQAARAPAVASGVNLAALETRSVSAAVSNAARLDTRPVGLAVIFR